MKKLTLLILGIVFLLGCEKQELKNDLIGCWIHPPENGSINYPNEPSMGLIGIKFSENGKCEPIFHDGGSKYYFNVTEGNWKLLSKNNIMLDWDANPYPVNGEYSFSIENNGDILHIENNKFIKIECDEITLE